MDLQAAFQLEALRALVALVRLLAIVEMTTHLSRQHTGPVLAAAPMPGQLLAADQLLVALQALCHAVFYGQRAQSLRSERGEEVVMAINRQWVLPFSKDTQDPQLHIVT